jgi:hypothetical protein
MIPLSTPRSVYLKKRRDAFFAAGRCTGCGAPREDLARSCCRRCLDYSNGTTTRRNHLRKAEGKCPRCGGLPKEGRVECSACLGKLCRKARTDRIYLRQIVLAHYGAVCTCCGEAAQEFLTVDHINGDGHLRRRQGVDQRGVAWYRQIIRAGFPEDLQLLCWNCNEAKRIYGTCPHTLSA